MGWFEDAGDNITAFFGGTSPEKVRANRQRVQAYQGANKPLPSIQRDLSNKQALAVPNRPVQQRPDDKTMADIVRRNTMPYNGGREIGNADGSTTFPEKEPPPPPPSILEILMGRLSEQYEGPDPSKMDFSSLDKALQTRLGMLGDARNRIQGNFNTSDANTAAMHSQFENQVRTEDANRYNQIGDQQKANLNANTQQGIGLMEASRAKAQAERQAMLQNLGIQEAGGAQDQGVETLNRGIQTLNERNTTNQNLADNLRSNNLSYNNTVAQSIGQQGVARRAALQQQLAGLMGKVDMAESEAKSQNEIERQRAISSAGDAGYDRWNDEQGRNMELFKTLSGQELQREKMNMPGRETRPSGINAVAYDLENSGADPVAAERGLAALSQILSEGNYLEGANGPEGTTPYDRANIMIQKLKAKGVDPMTATQVGTSYANL